MIAFINNYCCPYDDAWTQEVAIPLLSRKSGEDNLPARMPIEKQGVKEKNINQILNRFCKNKRQKNMCIHLTKGSHYALVIFLQLDQ